MAGVPTAMKITRPLRTASGKESENTRRPARELRATSSGRNFSWIGTTPAFSVLSFSLSLSTSVTSCPSSAKQAPATNPTYPDPTTATFIENPRRPTHRINRPSAAGQEQDISTSRGGNFPNRHPFDATEAQGPLPEEEVATQLNVFEPLGKI